MDAERTEIESLVVAADELSRRRQFDELGRLPNFVGIGAGRCGTTSIYDWLRTHPDVYVSPVKEINYFGVRDTTTSPLGMCLAEYRQYFAAAGDEPVVGEISPVYLTHDESAPALVDALGQPKVLITVRNPIEREISQFNSHFARHRWDDIDQYFLDGLGAIKVVDPDEYRWGWYDPANSLRQSGYATALERWIDLVGAANVHVIVFEDLVTAPGPVLDGLCDFLEVARHDAPLGMSELIPGALTGADRQRPAGETLAALADFHRTEVILLSAALGRNLLREWGLSS